MGRDVVTSKLVNRPKKHLGQNFLIDKNIVQKIVHVADIKKTDNVLEVGPGKGAITAEIAARAHSVLAVEKDLELATNLQEASLPRVEVLAGDILKITDEQLKDFFKSKPYRIIANLPYNISSEFIKLFLERDFAPTSMLLMLQKEVAERICSKNGENSVLSLSVQFYAEPKLEFVVKKNSFYPAPKIESAVIHINNIRQDKFAVDSEEFFKIVKLGFSQKRKQLKNNLKSYSEVKVQDFLKGRGYSVNARAEELNLKDWVDLVQKITGRK